MVIESHMGQTASIGRGHRQSQTASRFRFRPRHSSAHHVVRWLADCQVVMFRDGNRVSAAFATDARSVWSGWGQHSPDVTLHGVLPEFIGRR
jgi:hypothetical protein